MEDAPGGGGAEARARSRQYDYATNSNLVVLNNTGPRDAQHEPTGEPGTLRGRIDAWSFGDRAVQTRPPPRDEKPRGRKARDAADPVLPRRDAKRVRHGPGEVGVLSLAEEAVYEPRTFTGVHVLIASGHAYSA